MAYKTLTEELLDEIRNNDMQLPRIFTTADKYTDQILATEEVFWAVTRKQTGYGTYKWGITFANEYHFGNDIANILTKEVDFFITHDEDKTFTLTDFEEEINEALVNYIDRKSIEIKMEEPEEELEGI